LLAPLEALVPVVGDAQSQLGALVALLAAIGAIVAMATRVPGEARLESRVEGMEPERLWMIGPFIGAVGFVAGDSLGRLGLPGGDALVGVAFLVVLASVLLANHLPVVSRDLRRLMVAPFVFLSAVFLQTLSGEVVQMLGGEGGLAAGLLAPEQLALAVTFLVILTFVGGIFYMMLIFVPRELADPGASTRAWLLRFGLFYVSLLAAILLGSAVPIVIT
jgi:hypothetical protein